MKIIHILNFMGSGGVETFVKNMIIAQEKNGNNIWLITLLNNNTYNESDFSEYNVAFLNLKCKNYFELNKLLKLRKIIKNINPDIIHIHLFPAQMIVSLLLIGTRYKLITTEHGISLRRKKYKLFYILEKISFSRYLYIIGVSEVVSSKLIEEYPVFKNKIITINNGIDIDKMNNTPKMSKSEISEIFKENDKVICMVGRLEIGKDYETLIKTMSYLPKNVKLLIVGKGYRENELKKYVEKMSLSERVCFYGFNKEIFQIYKTIDIFVLSSEREGMPLVILESMAAGKPTIGSNVEGINNILKRNELLFEYKNEIDLKDKILMLLNNENKYKELSDYCLKESKKYSFNIMIEKYNGLYKDVLQ